MDRNVFEKLLKHVKDMVSEFRIRFECIIDQTQFTIIKSELSDIIDPDKDSLRFYRLGEKHKNKVEHVGVKEAIDLEDTLIF